MSMRWWLPCMLVGCATVSSEQVQDIFDRDGDGYDHPRWGGVDCDDNDATRNPDAEEVWYDGIDQDCDNHNDYDQDGDGVLSPRGDGDDCDDTNPDIYPGADELADGLDNDCDQLVDEPPGTVDEDLDGWSESEGDCDDSDPDIHPEATERWYDGVDQNCDRQSDYDRDGDGYDAEPYGGTDCDDTDAAVHPDAVEQPLNGIDDNCDGIVV